MERIIFTIIGLIVLFVLFALARVILGAILWLFFSLCAFIRKMIGRLGTWISGLILLAVIILAILLPKPFPTNQQFSPVYGTTLLILFIGSFLIWLFSLIGAYIRRDSELFEKLHAKGDVAGLIKFMRDKARPEEIRNAAIEVLVNIGETSIGPLIAILKENDADVTKALIKIGKPAVEPLIVALKNGNYNAAWVLGEIGDARAVEPLIVALKSDSEKVREAAAGALGLIGDTRAIEPLNVAVKDESEIVRQEATKALEKIDPKSKKAQPQEIPAAI